MGDSLASAEHQSVGHESQSSEISWEAVDEKDTRPPLWLPDYAVTNCMGCEASFWLGRRKHHCRFVHSFITKKILSMYLLALLIINIYYVLIIIDPVARSFAQTVPTKP